MSILPVSEAAGEPSWHAELGGLPETPLQGAWWRGAAFLEPRCRVCDPTRLNDRELHRVQKAGVCLIKQTGGAPPRMPPLQDRAFFGLTVVPFFPGSSVLYWFVNAFMSVGP